MSAITEIYTRLSDDATLAGLVGARIYPLTAPQGDAYPFVTFQVVSRTGSVALDTSSSMAALRLQVDCYGDTFTSARAVAEAVRARLDDWRGSGSVQLATLTNDRDQYDGDDAVRLYRAMQEYEIVFLQD